MGPQYKPIVWLHGKIASPPFSSNARIETRYLLRQIQKDGKSKMDKRKKKTLQKPLPDRPNQPHFQIISTWLIWRTEDFQFYVNYLISNTIQNFVTVFDWQGSPRMM